MNSLFISLAWSLDICKDLANSVVLLSAENNEVVNNVNIPFSVTSSVAPFIIDIAKLSPASADFLAAAAALLKAFPTTGPIPGIVFKAVAIFSNPLPLLLTLSVDFATSSKFLATSLEFSSTSLIKPLILAIAVASDLEALAILSFNVAWIALFFANKPSNLNLADWAFLSFWRSLDFIFAKYSALLFNFLAFDSATLTKSAISFSSLATPFNACWIAFKVDWKSTEDLFISSRIFLLLPKSSDNAIYSIFVINIYLYEDFDGTLKLGGETLLFLGVAVLWLLFLDWDFLYCSFSFL